jgi:TonB family protein
MYFDFEDNRPDTPTIGPTMSNREALAWTLLLHVLVILAIVVAPNLPFMRALEAKRLQAIEEMRQRELEREREAARFVFVQPRIDTPAPKPPPRSDLSDIDRRARTTERAPNPTNPLPFSRGNSPERMEAVAPVETRRQPAAPDPTPQPAAPQPEPDTRQGLTLPDAPSATDPRAADKQAARGPAVGVIADAIRNVQKYAQKDQFSNPQGGADQDFAPSIQFDTKGVEFGPWLRRFIAQIRRNWLIPYAAMSMRGHVVLTFNVHKDGRITDIGILRPSAIDAFNRSAQNAIFTTNPTVPLPPEYPDEKAFFTVTFFFNETPPTDR